jgi:5-methylcytosine-specific restriction endonuclease McrA
VRRAPLHRRRRPSTATLRKGRLVESSSGYRHLAGIAAERHGARCVVCSRAIVDSVHHVVPRSHGGDDTLENLAPVCGDGVAGCHGALTANDPAARAMLGAWIRRNLDVYDYVVSKQGDGWLELRYPSEVT